MKALWKSATVYRTGETFSFALDKSLQQHKTKGKGFTDVHITEKALSHFPVYFMQVSVYTLGTR